jgi:putative FmdB family regulatory protein
VSGNQNQEKNERKDMLYEYKCDKHGKFEARKPMDERFNADCPVCGAKCGKVFSIVNATWTWVLDSIKDDVPRRWHDPYH